MHNTEEWQIQYLLSEKKIYLKIIINEIQIENQIIKFFPRKWRNSIQLDKIGKILLSKTTIFKANSKIF